MAKKNRHMRREWTLWCGTDGEVDPQELAESMMDGAALLRRVGGVFQAAAIRVRDPETGDFWNQAIRFNWSSLPAQDLPTEEPVVQDGPVDGVVEDNGQVPDDEFMPVHS